MATSYPRRTHSGGIWRVTDVAKNLLEHGTWPGLGLPSGRGIFAAGFASPTLHNAEYVTISTTGNTSDFGDSTCLGSNGRSASNAVRAVLAVGYAASTVTYLNTIEYYTIATLGNAIDFGDLTAVRSEGGACSSPTRAVWAGGNDPYKASIDYVQIMTTGNAVDFGDLSAARRTYGAVSNGHGGLG